jgi:hypothetical protein
VLLKASDVVFVDDAAFRYLRWTYVLTAPSLNEKQFKAAFDTYYANEDNFVVLTEDGTYNIYHAIEGELPPKPDATAPEWIEEYTYYRGVKTKRLVRPMPSIAAQEQHRAEAAQVDGDYVYYRGGKTKIAKRTSMPQEPASLEISEMGYRGKPVKQGFEYQSFSTETGHPDVAVSQYPASETSLLAVELVDLDDLDIDISQIDLLPVKR